MNTFSSIPVHLQVKITEKMDCLDRNQFESSSKHGKYISNLSKRKPVLNISAIYVTTNDIKFCYQVGSQTFLRKWSQFLQFSYLPRFTVKYIEISSSSLNSIEEFCAIAPFTRNKVDLTYLDRSNPETILTMMANVFNISSVHVLEIVDPQFWHQPMFKELEQLSINASNLSDEQLLQLKFSSLMLKDNRDPSRIASISNSFFQEWFHGRRDIKGFLMDTQMSEINLAEDVLLSELPYSIIFKCEDSDVSWQLTMLSRTEVYMLQKNDVVFSVDRGDKKLMIVTGVRRVIAHEYIVLKELVEFQRSEWW